MLLGFVSCRRWGRVVLETDELAPEIFSLWVFGIDLTWARNLRTHANQDPRRGKCLARRSHADSGTIGGGKLLSRIQYEALDKLEVSHSGFC